MYNILKVYSEKYFDFNLNPEIRNKLIYKTLLSRLIELPIEEDEVDSLMPGRRDKIIKLPVLSLEKIKKSLLLINFKEDVDTKVEFNGIEAICLHYIKWRNINRMSKSKTAEFSQSIVDFAKQYVKLSKTGDYMCKSCNEICWS